MPRPFFENKKCTLAVVNGHKLKLYKIGILAQRIDRTAATVREWESKGIIPKSEFKDKYGRRLYTQEQIEVIHHYVKRDRVSIGRAFTLTNFSVHCHRAFAELHKQYFGGKENG